MHIKLYLLAIGFTVLFVNTKAQTITNYNFSATAGAFVAITGTQPVGTGNVDEGYWNDIPIGFDFWYMGIRYTTVSASTNGWLTLGAPITNAAYANNLSSGGSPRPVIAPLWDDLSIQAGTNTTYLTTGTAGNRVFTIQFLNSKWNYAASGSTISFQVKLFEGTGKIEFIYRRESGAVNNASASIGIAATATGNGNFLSLNGTGAAPSVNSTNQTSNLNTKPATDQVYAFSPAVPVAPTLLTFSDIAFTSMMLNWVDNANNESGFVIYRSTDGINYEFSSQVAANITSSNQNGLSANTTYYWRIFAVTEGALSTAITGSQATTCVGPEISQIPASGLMANYKFNGSAVDASGNNNGTLQNSPSAINDRFGIANKAYSFNGSSQYMSTANSYANPANFSISIWFKTATTTGGRLIGFGNAQTGSSYNYDRHLYMNNAGQIYFGVFPGTVVTVNSALSYNDDNWHLATATMSSATGMALYIDGALVGTNANTGVQNYTGYWRVGYDNNNGWTSQPSSFYFNGTLDDILIYNRALSAGEINTLFISPDGAGSNGPLCSGSTLNLSATTVAGASYAWTGPNGFTSTSQNPAITYVSSNAGVYTLQATLSGCTVTAYTNVVSSTNPGQWTGATSTDWADATNWCNGVVPTSATNVTIASTATRMPSITSLVTCNNLTINAGATLTTAAAGTLNIHGTLTNSGTMTNNGTTGFTGTSGQQTFSGISNFYNLTLNNSNGLLLPTAIAINNNLTLTAGTLNANNFNVSVKGNWTNNLSATAYIAGTGTVSFNGSAAQVIGGTFSTSFNNVNIVSTASTVTLNVNATVGGNLTVSSGTLDLGSFTINRTTAGGTLMVSNNAVLKIGGTNSYPSNYTTNTLVVASTVEYSGTNQTVANQAYGNLALSSATGSSVKTFPATALSIAGNLSSAIGTGTSVTYTAASIITVSGNVSIGASTIFNGSSYAHSIAGNWTNSGTFNGNTGTITFTGTGTAVSGTGAQNFNNLTIAASSVTFSNSSVSLSGNLATSGAGSFSQAAGGTLTMTGAGKTISGSGISLDNLTISGSVSSAISFTLTGNLSVSGSFAASAGTVTMSGAAKTISGTGSKSFYTLSANGSITTAVNFSIANGLAVAGSLTASSGTATFTGTSSLSGTANLFNTTINGTSLQLSSNAVLGVSNLLTITAGILNVTSSTPNTVNFNGSGAQNINAISYGNLILSNGNTKTASGNITTNNHVTIGTGTIFNAGSYTLSVYGNWINNGTFTAATSTVQFLGPATAYLTGATTFNILTSNTSSSTTELILQSNVSAATVNMTNGIITTGVNTITITTTRTGNGFIYGNIQRTHAFTTGVAYAFEGPENTINFSAVSAVTSITVSVTKGSIGDFPFGGSISRVYNITVPAGTYTATLRLHYEDDELNGNVESTMDLWKYNGTVWTATGKTGNSTTTNYVEQSGLTNITNRWTCSDNSNVVQWNGSVSTDWNNVANWTVLQGSASKPPTATDIVNLGTAPFTFEPSISNAVNVKNIIFGSTQAVSLTMAAGGTLTTGDISGSWSNNKTHTINANNQTITINGALPLSDGTSGHAINLNIGSGTVNVNGSLTQSGGSNIVFTSSGNLNIAGDHNYVSGTFNPGTGTVTYNGAVNQVIAALDYYNLTIHNPNAVVSINNTTNIAGNLYLSSGNLDNNSTTTVSGNVTISSGAAFQNLSILHVGGNWLNNGTFIATGASIFFDGSGTQTISASTFNNLNINKPVGSIAELTGDVVIKENLVVTSGTLNIKSFTCDRILPGGNIILADSATLIVGANNAPFNFTSGSIANSSTVIADGTGPQAIYGESYGNMIFRNAGLKTLITPITVNGTLTIESGATFDGGSGTLTLNGNWNNAGTFTPSSSTVICAGTSKNISGVTNFNQMTVSGSYTILSNLSFNNLLNITSTGSLTGGSSIQTTLHGDLVNSGILYSLGTTTFTGNVVQTMGLINAVQTVALIVTFNGSVSPVFNSTSTPQFGYINVNNTGGVNPSVGWTILYGLTVGSGASFNLGNSTHNILGSVNNNGTITSAGTLNLIPSSPVTINFGTGFSSTGTVNFGGAGAMTLAGTPTGFNNVLLSNTNAAGISPASAWTMANNFTLNNGSVFNAGAYTNLVGGNFLNNGIINAGTSTFTLNGNGTQDVYTASALNNFTLNKAGGTAVLYGDATVNGTLNFVSGLIKTGSYKIIQPSAGTVTGAAQNTGWVNGKMQKTLATGATSKTFEIGDSISYTPVATTFSNISTAGSLTVFTTQGDHPGLAGSPVNASRTANRFWTIFNNGLGFTDYSATFNFVSTDVDAGANTAAFSVINNNGSSWTIPVTENPNPTNIQATGLTSFNHFVVGEICNKGTSIAYLDSVYCTDAGTATVTIAGTTGGSFSSDVGLSINASTGNIDLAASTTGSHIITYTVAATGNCSEFITSTSITIGIPGAWTGALNTDWNNVNNWSCGSVPNAANNVVISSGLSRYPVITTNMAVHDISILAGATITVNNAILQIGGTTSGQGVLVATEGSVEFNGISAQEVPPGFFANSTIKNLIVSNDLSLLGADTLTGTLTIAAGKTLFTNDKLVLNSDSIGTARIATLPVDGAGNATAFINGKITVERFIPARRVWRLLSAPLSSTNAPTINESWQEGVTTASADPNPNPGYGTHITGGTVANGFDQNATNSASIKYFNPVSNTLPGVSSTNLPITTYPGYFLFVRGDRTNNLALGANAPATNTTLRMKGNVATGHQVKSIQSTHYTLVGNPYPSPIDFETITKTNVANTIYIWDPKLGGNYGVGGYVAGSWNAGTSSYNFTSAISPVSQYIPSGEAFFVVSADEINTGSVTIKETDKTDLGSDQLFGRLTTNPSVRIDLVSIAANGTTSLADGTLATYYAGNSNAVDREDAKKMINSGENIALHRDGKLLSIERRKDITVADTLYLNTTRLKPQAYNLTITMQALGTGMVAMLKDKLTGSTLDNMILDAEGSSTVNFTVTSNAATYAADRFSIVFMPANVVPVTIKSIKAVQQQKDILVSWQVENEVNILRYDVETSADGTAFSKFAEQAATGISSYSVTNTDLSKGLHFYRVLALGANGEKQYSAIAKLMIENNKQAAISFSPNQVVDNNLNLILQGLEKEIYQADIYNASGQWVYRQTIQHNTGNGTYKITLPAKLPAGKYELILTGASQKLNNRFIKL